MFIVYTTKYFYSPCNEISFHLCQEQFKYFYLLDDYVHSILQEETLESKVIPSWYETHGTLEENNVLSRVSLRYPKRKSRLYGISVEKGSK